MSNQEETVYGMNTSTSSIETLGVAGSNLNLPSGSNTANSMSSGSDANAVMNDKVQALAGSIYEEFETMMSKFGPDVVKNLMPLIVNVLESLDLAYTENQEMEVEVELLKEDNEQLVTQYEREKGLRKTSEGRLIELEDVFETEKKENVNKVESLTSIVKMFELKAKNSQDQISRLDEKETEMKKEYAKLHDRYTELFKTHIDHMERTKSMIGSEKMEQIHGIGASRGKIPSSLAVNQINNRSSGPVSFGYSELENNNSQNPSIITTPDDYNLKLTDRPPGHLRTLKNELKSPGHPGDLDAAKGQERLPPSTEKTSEKKNLNKLITAEQNSTTDQTPTKAKVDDEIQEEETPTDKSKYGKWMEGVTPDAEVQDLEIDSVEDISKNPSIGPATPMSPQTHAVGLSQTKAETRTGNTLYQELSFQDAEAIGEVDEGADITDNESDNEESRDQGFDNASDNYFGMGKEVENLIAENNELLATKNALNIVKDDLIAKVDELTGEHEILREEIKSLQTIRTRLESKTKDLEDEVKKVKEEAEKAAKAAKSEEEEDVPLAQRKRFTRVEMARVLMERNQYKERFMELQEAVRWTEMMRASKTTEQPGNSGFEKKSGKQGIWKFFGSLFSGSTESFMPSSNTSSPTRQMKYSTSSGNIGLDSRSGRQQEQQDPATLQAMRAKISADRRSKNNPELFDGDTMSKSSERKDEYKQVRAHVKKEDGRMQAYGWSLPAKQSSSNATDSSDQHDNQPSERSTNDIQVQSRAATSGVPVPVPVYCRPLMEKEQGMKIWCAAGVNMTGGKTKDGGNAVGASVFYDEKSKPKTKQPNEQPDEVKKLDQELEEAKQIEAEARETEHQLSSHVWICTSTHAVSKVTVIDANSPSDHLESFHVCSSHLLCIASIPGSKDTDFRVDEELNRRAVEESDRRESERLEAEREIQEAKEREKLSLIKADQVPGGGGVGSITFVRGDEHDKCVGIETGKEAEESYNEEEEVEEQEKETLPKLTKETALELGSKAALNRTMDVFKLQELSEDPDPHATLPFISHHTLNISRDLEDDKENQDNPEQEEGRSTTDAVHRRLAGQRSKKLADTVEDENVEKMSSVLPTMWLGSQSGSIYVHSSVSQWKRCIHSIRLKDSVLAIVHVKGRVLASLADGTIAIFNRSTSDHQWDLVNYHLLDLGTPRQSIRCLIQVHDKVWCGYRNKIFVVNPRTMSAETTFDAHPRKESQVRQMTWVGDGVWISIRLDSTLRLFHAHTLQHLQDVDIEPYVSKMLGTGKLGFSFVRITALLVSNFRLWMGTGNGVIISVPLATPTSASTPTSQEVISEALKRSGTTPMTPPGSTVRVYADNQQKIRPESFIPFCNMANAQLSFHGHRDAVKFFVSVPGHGGLALNPTLSPVKTPSQEDKEAASMLVMSGGEGYIDFRIVDDGSDQDYDSHIMVWQLPMLPPDKIAKLQELRMQRNLDGKSSNEATFADAAVSSRTSSSLDLGPTPGSGVITVDSEGEADNDDVLRADKLPEQFEPMNEIDSYTNWNKDVESLLNAEVVKERRDQQKSELRPTPSPKEDFTQGLKYRTDEE